LNRISFKKVFTRLALIGASLVVLFFILNFFLKLPPIPAYSTVVTADKGEIIHAFLSKDDKWRFKISTKEIHADLKTAFINKEDKYFYYHPGINLIAITRAAFNNILKNKKTSGASTITMQVVRLLEPRERTYLNKFVEIFRALQLELTYSKEEILELYINFVPYGSNIEGVKAASLLYFQKSPEQLSLAQIVSLTIIPNRPVSLNPQRHPDVLMVERNKWLKRFADEELFESSRIQDAIKEQVYAQRKALPKRAQHLSIRLHKKYPLLTDINTNIKLSTQERAQIILENYMARIKQLAIHNSALIIFNNETKKTEAYIGSQNFNDLPFDGQVDGVNSIRSPGSTLKPFIYGMAFDKGILTPKMVIEDIPTNFDGYVPTNFDEHFNGLVSVEKSLAYSLNIPAVKTIEQLTPVAVTKTLVKSGFKQIKRDEKHLGLSLSLGGCGVTLEELTHLYTIFAQKGLLYSYPILQQDSSSLSTPVLSESSSYMISEILTQITRPDLPNNMQSSFHVPHIAWKTGTSYGRKDAWCVGYNQKYTIGVWVGNFDATGIHELTGADIATPLLFELFNTLDYNSQQHWFFKPRELELRTVCTYSGLPMGEFCTESMIDQYLPKISTNQKCEHLKEYVVSANLAYSYCTSCTPDGGYITRTYPNLSAALADFYDSQHIPYEKPPIHNPMCVRIMEDNNPKIVMPIHNKEYLIERAVPTEIQLKCITPSDVLKVYWYINGKFYKEASPKEEVFFLPKEGISKISCSDDRGRNSSVSITTEFY